MKATISKREFLRVLGHAVGVAEKKSTMPMLANVLLTVKDGALSLATTDLYMALFGSVPVDGLNSASAQPGSVAVSAKDLFDRIRVLPDGPIQMTVGDNQSLSLKAGGTSRKFTLRGANGEDYPPLPVPDNAAAFNRLPARLLSSLIAKCRPSISTDETRAHLNSALFEWSGELVRMVATDGHRLSKAEATVPGSSGSVTMLIPLKAIGTISALCDLAVSEAAGDEDAVLEFTVVGPNAFFKVAGLTFSAKLVDATFPPWEKVVPSTSARQLTVTRTALADIVKAVSIASSDKTGGIKLSVEKRTLRVTAESADGGDAYDDVAIETGNGDRFVTGANARYITDALAAITSDEVSIGLVGELDPIVIRPIGAAGNEFLSVIMPMRV